MFKNKIHHIVAWTLFIIIIAGYALMALKFPLAYIFATYEDLIGEWAQVFVFALTLLLAVHHAIVSHRFRLFFILLALACFYVVGEEISWGQRIFDISSPDYFLKHNLQKETNLHNFVAGPISTATKQILTYSISLGLVVYGLFYPWLLQRNWVLACWLEKKGLAAPPLYLWPFFVGAAIFELESFRFNEAEIAELLIPIALTLMTLNYLMAYRYQVNVHQQKNWNDSVSFRMAKNTVLVIVCVVGFSIGTTATCYSSPRLKLQIEQRYWLGVETFARRYMGVTQWENATHLYLLIQEKAPHRASIRRDLFRCYTQVGMKDEAQWHLDKAIETDLLRLKKKDNLTAHISLARNYRLQKDREKENYHLNRALDIGLKRKVQNPNNANTAYWLGKTFMAQGNLISAVSEFRRASILQPHSFKYRKILLDVRSQLGKE